MKLTKKKKLVMILSLVWSLSIFSVATYAWVSRSWEPELEYSEVTIATSGALVITIENKETGEESIFNEVDLNEYTNTTSFSLKQVSSADGISFLSADFTPTLEGKVPVYNAETEGKYIKTEFWLVAQPNNDPTIDNIKDVFIHEETKIEYTNSGIDADLEQAIRISIELPKQTGVGSDVYILGKDQSGTGSYFYHTGATTDALGEDVFNDYHNDKETLNSGATGRHVMYPLHYFDGSDASRTLCRVTSSTKQKVVIRIWLEGCDPNCVSGIAGERFSLTLKFDTRDVEN